VKNHFLSISIHHREMVSVTEDAYNLAENYINEKVVGETSFDDCVHIATATIHKVDYPTLCIRKFEWRMKGLQILEEMRQKVSSSAFG